LVSVEVDRLVLALEAERFLAAWDDNDPAAVASALARMIDAYVVSIIEI
jgi:hypothetical protein